MTALAVIVGVLALAVLAMALRQAGIRADAADADSKRMVAEAQLGSALSELEEHRKRTEAQLAALRSDIVSLEDDLAACSGPGDRRRRLERLLSKAEPGDPGGGPKGLLDRGWTSS